MDAMAFELQILGWAALLWAVQLVLMAVPANRQLSPSYLASPRDEQRPLTGVTARLERAYKNHLEALLFFAVAVLVVVLGGASTALTEQCAIVFLVARVVYVPLYALGVPWLRSVVWAAGFFAAVVMLLSVLV